MTPLGHCLRFWWLRDNMIMVFTVIWSSWQRIGQLGFGLDYIHDLEILQTWAQNFVSPLIMLSHSQKKSMNGHMHGASEIDQSLYALPAAAVPISFTHSILSFPNFFASTAIKSCLSWFQEGQCYYRIDASNCHKCANISHCKGGAWWIDTFSRRQANFSK